MEKLIFDWNEIILRLSLTVIVSLFWVSVYQRRKSPRFRVVETWISGDGVITRVVTFSPQVKVNGIWYWLIAYYENDKLHSAILDTQISQPYLDIQDALALIDKFKSAGNYTIPSNQKLKSNQKAIEVE